MVRTKIDKLLDYWIDISKRQTLTIDDYRLFFDKAKATWKHFYQAYPRMASEGFLLRVQLICVERERFLEAARNSKKGMNAPHAQMKNVAKKFVSHIKEWFASDIVALAATKTPVQDAESILKLSSKLTYRWAAGIVASNHIASRLIKLSGPTKTDDIKTLYTNLKNNTTNQKLKRFLQTSYTRFDGADKTRNRCAHVNLGEPTKQEIEQLISTARLLQKFK
jgi:hypothetical protein